MRLVKKFYPLILFILITCIGAIRKYQINSYEVSVGKSTMTGTFTFMAYGIIAIIILTASLLILRISLIKENTISKYIKLIFIITVIILSTPAIIAILILFH